MTLDRIGELYRDAQSDAPDMDDVSIDRAELMSVLRLAERAIRFEHWARRNREIIRFNIKGGSGAAANAEFEAFLR